ncbi:MAG: TIGR03086 family metal-binding protein [Mycobacteriales bacterium]
MADDPLALLSRSLDQLGRVIDGIDRERQARLPTPCRSWDVGMLVGHVLNGLTKFALAAEGKRSDQPAEPREVSGDWMESFRERSEALLDTWRKVGVTGTIMLPDLGEVPAAFPVFQQMTELTVHAWDLAVATGQSLDLDPEVTQDALEWATGALRPEFRGDEDSGKGFGPAVDVPADASPTDRLVAWFGRQPA